MPTAPKCPICERPMLEYEWLEDGETVTDFQCPVHGFLSEIDEAEAIEQRLDQQKRD